jgi:hypothetical protein
VIMYTPEGIATLSPLASIEFRRDVPSA